MIDDIFVGFNSDRHYHNSVHWFDSVCFPNEMGFYCNGRHAICRTNCIDCVQFHCHLYTEQNFGHINFVRRRTTIQCVFDL